MLAQGLYPVRLKFSLNKSIYISGDKSSTSNYRGIPLLPVISKIFEKVINKRLFNHLNNNAILNEHQYGFRSEVSAENSSYILLNEILTALNNKQMVGRIFCELHKAFDCINHSVLLEKMKFYLYQENLQFNTVLFRWKVSNATLSHINCIESTWEKIKQGVTQGSLLVHIFFNLHK